MFNKKLNEFKDRQTEIADKTHEYTNADESFYLTANAVLNLAKKAKDVFMGSEIAEKRQLLNFLLQNCQLNEKNLEFSLRKPFDAIANYSQLNSELRALKLFRTAIWQIPGNISPFKIVNYW